MPSTSTSAIWELYISKGNSFERSAPIFYRREKDRRVFRDTSDNITIINPNTFAAYDINNDGKTELIMLESRRSYHKEGYSNNGVIYSRSYSITAKVFTTFGGEQKSIQYGVGPWETVVLNDSNISDELALNSRDMMGVSTDLWTGSILKQFVLTSMVGTGGGFGNEQYVATQFYTDIATESRLIGITQGNITTQIKYSTLEKDGRIYDGVQTENYPYVEINQSSGMYVVSEMSQTSSSPNPDKLLRQKFSYRGLVSNILGKGLVGFRKTARTNWYADDLVGTVIWSGVEIDPVNEGIPVKEWSVRTYNDYSKIFPADVSENNSGLLSFKSIAYQIDKLLNGQMVTTVPDADKAKAVTAIVPKTTKTKDFLTGVTSENNIIYGSYYLPGVSITSINGNFGVSTKRTIYTHNPSGQGKDYFIGRVRTIANDESAYSDVQRVTGQYTYENNRLKTVAVTAGNDTGRAITDEFTYDGFGNVTQKVTSNAYDAGKQTEKTNTILKAGL